MRSFGLVVIQLAINFGICTAQTLEWAVPIGGKSNESSVHTATDGDGNVVSSGTFSLAIDFDPGPGEFVISSAAGNDVFVQKLDAAGNFLWAISFASVNFLSTSDIEVDSAGDIVVFGQFKGTVDFDPSTNQLLKTAQGGTDLFIVKLSPMGQVLWVKTIGSDSEDYGSGIEAASNNDIVICGSYAGKIDFDPGQDSIWAISNGGRDIFVIKLTSQGDFVWGNSFGDSGEYHQEFPTALALGPLGDIIMTGSYEGFIDFGSGLDTVVINSPDTMSMFIVKMSSVGEALWAKSIAGYEGNRIRGIASNSQGDIIFTGWFLDSVDFDPGPTENYVVNQDRTDMFITTWDSMGNFRWTQNLGAQTFASGESVVVNANDDIFVNS